MVKPSLPPGFRFHPTDVELVKYFLKRKILGKKLLFEGITEIDIHKYPPWDLPAKSSLPSGDLKWYFFSPVERKYASGGRMNRATEFGYWKTTGKDRPVHYNNEVVGMIKTLIFHIGRAPRGERTNWVIHEYRLVEKNWADNGIVQDSYVLCMVYEKDGPGPRNSAQYGAPFNEEDWTDDEEENGNGQSVNASIVEVLPSSQTGTESVPITAHYTGCPSVLNIPYARPLAAGCSSVSNISYVGPLAGECSSASKTSLPESLPLGCLSVSENPYAGPRAGYDATAEKQVSEVDDIEAMLALFVEEECNDPQGQKDKGIPCTHGADIYKDLGDLGNLAALHEDNIGTSAGHEACNTWGQMLPLNDVAFLEMIDLETPLSCPNELFKDGYNYF